MDEETALKIWNLFQFYTDKIKSELNSNQANLMWELAKLMNIPEERVNEAMEEQLVTGKLPTLKELIDKNKEFYTLKKFCDDFNK